ncbi:MAG: HNH endonuclease [Ideonella sp.]|nr:HNH endonuclease [Ideonella sp.]
MAKTNLTAQRLRELLHYDPETGIFTWGVSHRNGIHCGRQAGCISKHIGYRLIRIDGILYLAHRLAWIHSTGVFPSAEIDHINGNRADNRLCNLRDVSRAINSNNSRIARSSNKSSGLLGTYKVGNSFCAHIMVSGVTKHLGSFKTKELAHTAYLEAKRKLHVGSTI